MFHANRGFPVKLSNNRTRAREALENGAVLSRSLQRRIFQPVRLRATSQIEQRRMQRSKYRTVHSGFDRLIRGILLIANPSLRRTGPLAAEQAGGDLGRSRASLEPSCAKMLSPCERARHPAYI